MGIRRALNSKSSVAHADGSSSVHEQHVHGKKQNAVYDWIPVPAHLTPEGAKDVFALDLQKLGLPAGMSWLNKDGKLYQVPGGEFQRTLNEARQERSWYNQRRKLEGGKWSTSRRTRKNPVEECVINFSPAQQRYFKTLPNKEAILLKVLQSAQPLVDEFKKETGRDVLALAVHWDSSKVHFNIYHSRISKSHSLVGKQRLGTLGAWSVGQDRLQKLGVGGEAGNNRLAQNIALFEQRRGKGAVPLDLHLHRLLDDNFEEHLSQQELSLYRECEEFHRNWKKNQRQQIEQKSNPDAVGMNLLHLLLPFVPKELRLALKIVRTIKAATEIITAFPGSDDSATNPNPQNPK